MHTSTIAKPLYCSRKTVLICKSVQLVKTQHLWWACGKADSHCVDVYTRSLFMSIVQRLSETEYRFSLHSGDLKSFLFWRLSIRYPSCIFHPCCLLMHFPLPRFQRPHAIQFCLLPSSLDVNNPFLFFKLIYHYVDKQVKCLESQLQRDTYTDAANSLIHSSLTVAEKSRDRCSVLAILKGSY